MGSLLFPKCNEDYRGGIYRGRGMSCPMSPQTAYLGLARAPSQVGPSTSLSLIPAPTHDMLG